MEDALPIVAVSVEPHRYVAERIAGDCVRVVVLVPPGKEPETYQATPDKIAALSKAKVFFSTGIPIEKTLLPKVQSLSRDLKCIDLRTGLPLRKLELHQHEHNGTEPGHAESEFAADGDPHIWFAPELLKYQALAILNALKTVAADKSDVLEQNYTLFIKEIETLQRDIAKQLEPVHGKTVFVFHPAYGYFCDEFGLQQRAIEFEGKTPSPKQIAEIVTEMKASGTKPVIFVQPEFNQSAAKAVAEAAGGTVIVHSPLEYDILKNIKHFAEFLIKH
jgi:zinc transport system substrate-binding protein